MSYNDLYERLVDQDHILDVAEPGMKEIPAAVGSSMGAGGPPALPAG